MSILRVEMTASGHPWQPCCTRTPPRIDALVETGAGTVPTGHGEPWTDGIEDAVARARAARRA